MSPKHFTSVLVIGPEISSFSGILTVEVETTTGHFPSAKIVLVIVYDPEAATATLITPVEVFKAEPKTGLELNTPACDPAPNIGERVIG